MRYYYDTKMNIDEANQFARCAVAHGYYTQSGVSIKRFGDELNITISLEHFMDFGDNRFPCIDADTGEVTDYYDFMIEKL